MLAILWLQTQHLFEKKKKPYISFSVKKILFIYLKKKERERARNSNSKGHSIRIEKWIIDTYLLTLFSLGKKKETK